MEDIKTEPQKIFEDLTKEERKLLHKEFYKDCKFSCKFYFWSGIGLLILALINGGFSFYYMINIFFTGFVAFQLYISAVIFTVGCSSSMLLTSQYHKKFFIWLKDYKNIVRKIDTINNCNK